VAVRIDEAVRAGIGKRERGEERRARQGQRGREKGRKGVGGGYAGVDREGRKREEGARLFRD
jgi:hypothetical protein